MKQIGRHPDARTYHPIGRRTPWRVAREPVLAAEPDLAALVDPGERALATQASVARLTRLDPGVWNPASVRTDCEDGIGLLVVRGLLRRRAGWEDRHGAELLGEGDVLRPWEDATDPDAMLVLSDDWRVLATTELAVLDRQWAARMARWPTVVGALVGRSLARARRAVTLMALCQIRRLDVRVWLLLWHLAERFGRVRSDGVHVELRLTHEALGELIGARRPSVSAALSRLDRQGCLRRTGRGWVLLARPPGADAMQLPTSLRD